MFVGVKNVLSPCGNPSKYSPNTMQFVFLYCQSKNMVDTRQHIKVFLLVHPCKCLPTWVNMWWLTGLLVNVTSSAHCFYWSRLDTNSFSISVHLRNHLPTYAQHFLSLHTSALNVSKTVQCNTVQKSQNSTTTNHESMWKFKSMY